uniref:Uncharacterized protein n=1 Tax=Knipowitschia caucasica TaxID=637954 RepID=A0AAV2JLA2_KNICA
MKTGHLLRSYPAPPLPIVTPQQEALVTLELTHGAVCRSWDQHNHTTDFPTLFSPQTALPGRVHGARRPHRTTAWTRVSCRGRRRP